MTEEEGREGEEGRGGEGGLTTLEWFNSLNNKSIQR